METVVKRLPPRHPAALLTHQPCSYQPTTTTLAWHPPPQRAHLGPQLFDALLHVLPQLLAQRVKHPIGLLEQHVHAVRQAGREPGGGVRFWVLGFRVGQAGRRAGNLEGGGGQFGAVRLTVMKGLGG